MTPRTDMRHNVDGDRKRGLRCMTVAATLVVGLAATGIMFPIAPASATTTPGTLLWSAKWDGAGRNDVPVAHALSPDGGTVVLVGKSINTKGNLDIATAAFNAADGSHLWATTFDGRAHSNDRATDVAFTSGGIVVVTGRSDGGASGADFLTIAYDGATGTMLWHARLDGGSQKNDSAAAIVARPDGAAVFVTGPVERTKTGNDFETAAYDSTTGATLWDRRWAGEHPHRDNYDSAAALAISAGGDELFVTGVTFVPDVESSWLPAVIAYDTSTGAKLWASQPVSGFCIFVSPRAIALAPDGLHAYVVGYEDTGCNASIPGSFAVAVATNDGGSLWQTGNGEYDVASRGATAVVVRPDGQQVIQTGQLASTTYGTQAYDAGTGTVDWTKHYSGTGRGPDVATAIAASPDSSSVCITGESDGGASSGNDIATLCYATADGQTLWTARYDDPSSWSDGGADISVSADGSVVYVSGHAGFQGSGENFIILAYAA